MGGRRQSNSCSGPLGCWTVRTHLSGCPGHCLPAPLPPWLAFHCSREWAHRTEPLSSPFIKAWLAAPGSIEF